MIELSGKLRPLLSIVLESGQEMLLIGNEFLYAVTGLKLVNWIGLY